MKRSLPVASAEGSTQELQRFGFESRGWFRGLGCSLDDGDYDDDDDDVRF